MSKERYILNLLLVTCLILYAFLTIFPAHPVSAESGTGQSDTTEGVRLERFVITAPQLRITEREIFVHLPPDYFTSEKSYPVLYLHDGGMLFSLNGGHDTRFNTVLDQLHEEGFTEGIIAVGISSSQNRWDEYSPWVNENMDIWAHWSAQQIEGGEGDAYLEFIVNTLKPHIDEQYRTLDAREHTAIGGFSMGGLISLYAGIKHPDVFSRVMAMSPAIWFAEEHRAWNSNNQLVGLIQNENVPHDVKFYLDIGTNEWVIYEVPVYDENGSQYTYPHIWVDGTDMVHKALIARDIPEDNLLFVVDEGGVHEAADWNERFSEAMKWLFEDPMTPAEPESVVIAPREEAFSADTPTPPATKEPDPPAPEVDVMAADREPFPYAALAVGIALLTGSVLIFLWIFYRYR